MGAEVSIREWTRFSIASNCETHCKAIVEKEEIGNGDRERRENLYWLVFRAIYREKPEKGLRIRDWKELCDAEVEAEVDRRFGTRQREPKTKKPGARAP